MEITKKLKTPGGSAFLAALISGFVAHLFGLVNVIHNYDSVYWLPYDYGSGLPHGRWGLAALGELSELLGGNCNLPLVNGLLFVFFAAVAAGLLVSALDVKGRSRAILMGILIAVFPTSASILIHRFTATYYGISMVLSVLAVWVIRRGKLGFLWSVLCITASLGIYQAFIPMTISLFVLLMIQEALRGESGFGAIVRHGLVYCAALILGLVFYYIIMKVTTAVWGASLVDYQGIETMGQIELSKLPRMVRDAIYLVCMMPLKDYCGLSSDLFMKVAYLLLGGMTALMVGYILIFKIKNLLMAALTAVLCVLFLLAVNFIYIMVPGGVVYTLMVYSFAVLACAPIVIFECLPPEEGRKADAKRILSGWLAAASILLSFSYAYRDNTNYTAMYYANEQVKYFMNSMVTQVRLTDGYDTEKEWAFVGHIRDSQNYFVWDKEITYGGFANPDNLLNCHSTFSWMYYCLGYQPAMADKDRIAELSQLEEVKQMPCWPNKGCIKAVGDAMVIKFEELS